MIGTQKNTKAWILSTTILLLVCNGVTALPAADNGFDYTTYARLLEDNVDDNGMVDYKILEFCSAKLNDVVNSFAVVEQKDYGKWTKDRQLAFWINAYNALTLKVVVDNFPIKSSWLISLNFPKNSIRQISGVWDKIKFNVMGSQITLNHIEHEILRKEFDEPRIHFAIVCASIGCPALRNEPYTAKKLSVQLDDQVKKFLADETKFRFSDKSGSVSISPIFKWFGDDFVKLYSKQTTYRGHNNPNAAIVRFIIENLPEIESNRWQISSKTYKISYLDYDWSLNEQKSE